MPKEEKEVLETPDNFVIADSDDLVVVDESEIQDQDKEQDKEPETYIGSYKSKDEAEKGLAEKDKTIDKLRSERDKALSSGTKVQGELLEKLAQVVTKQNSKSGSKELNEEFDSLAKRFENGDGRDQLEVIRDVLVDSETAQDAKYMAEIADLKSQVSGLVEKVSISDNPLKESILELEKEMPGLTNEVYTKMAEKLEGLKGNSLQPPRPNLPGNTGGQQIAGSAENTSKLSSKQEAFIKAQFGDVTPEEVEQLRKGI